MKILESHLVTDKDDRNQSYISLIIKTTNGWYQQCLYRNDYVPITFERANKLIKETNENRS